MKAFLFILVSVLLVGQSVSAKQPDAKQADAEIKEIKLGQNGKATISFDFIGLFSIGVTGEYERYLKLGYPYISKTAFEARGPGGVAIFNNSTKIRKLNTTNETIFKAYCKSKHSEAIELTKIDTAHEFKTIVFPQQDNKTDKSEIISKYGDCFSMTSNVVSVAYKGKHIVKIHTQWMP